MIDKRYIILYLLFILTAVPATAQIKIGGNVYGGGNHGNVAGSTKVTVKEGDIGARSDADLSKPLKNPRGRVFGGARMANVGGNTFVNIDGNDTNAEGYILINQVYSGNDVAGTIGTSSTLPAELEGIRRRDGDEANVKLDSINNTWNSFVRVSTKTMDPENPASYYTAEEIAAASRDIEAAAYGKRTTDIKPAANAKKVYIGQLFGGGNGDFKYTDEEGNPLRDGDDYIIKEDNTIIARSATPFVRPEQEKTYLEINGGSIVYAYGGGNNATVNQKTVIHVDNPSAVVNHIFVDKTTWQENTSATAETESIKNLLTDVRFVEMGINTTFSQPSSGAYQVGRFFGGNNHADMHIRPTWNLIAGKIRNLYSGGNSGRMTSSEGLLLEIPEYSSLIVDNLYGGCRMADVIPTVEGVYTPCSNLTHTNYPLSDLKHDYNFPDELAARTLVYGGHIHNVYGGNDVTGTVYGGNAVGIYTTVYGNVYGGGNGNYPYTDRSELQNNSTFADFYYGDLITDGKTSYEALNEFRPNAEQVSIRLKGTGPASPELQPTYTSIKGSVFVGGNCASLRTKKNKPLVELKMGSYVIADKVFLGNNGAGMVDDWNLKYYDGYIDENDAYTSDELAGTTFSSLNLKEKSTFAGYMEGVCMNLQPNLVFDNVNNGDPVNYQDYTSYVGSFYCGGNIGSMGIANKNIYRVEKKLNIYEKFVGGCHHAYVPAGTYNAVYEGGVIGVVDERENFKDGSGKIKDRLQIDLENLTITPLRWNDTFEKVAAGTLTAGKEYYTTDLRSSIFTAEGGEVSDPTDPKKTYYELTQQGNQLIWNTAKWDDDKGDFMSVANDAVDGNTRLLQGNVYGGCYESGIVNGNVIVNINQNVLNKDDVFGSGPGIYNRVKSGVQYEKQRDDLNAIALTLFGAGCGKGTEIWGSTTVNHNNGYVFQIFGGGEEGYVGQKKKDVNGNPVLEQVFDKLGNPVKDESGNPVYEYVYEYDPAYSTTVNLKGTGVATASEGAFDDLAETEYIYGGGNEGDVCGNTLVNLGNGRIYDAFGGASDANILGHSEVYIGRQPKDGGGYKDGFPWIRDIVYGGNDFGGVIEGEYEGDYDFENRIKEYSATKASQLQGNPSNSNPGLLKSSAYVEYIMGRVDTIYGGNYAYYNYAKDYVGSEMPYLKNTFVNIRPKSHDKNYIVGVFGGGTGYPKNRDGDKSLDHSYVLIDIPDDATNFSETEIFGAGSYNGLGMRYLPSEIFGSGFNRDECSAVIDLLHGEVGYTYGGSYNEGVTARTLVNVPEKSTIKIKKIFGGAFGTQILPPCDVIQSIVNYRNTDETALVTGAIYGGNNSERRALFTQVNISSPVWSNKAKGYLATVYGAGYGIDTWSEHTQVNLLDGAKVYEVYGGGEMGHVLNAESVQKYMQLYKDGPSNQISTQDPYWKDSNKWTYNEETKMRTVKAEYKTRWDSDWHDAWKLGNYYITNEDYSNYFEAFAALENTSLVRKAEIDDRDYTGYSNDEKEKRYKIYNTNVIINEGAEVVNYAYGGGLGKSGVHLSGDVYGETYIALLGGTVKKDIYAAGTAGAVNDVFGVGAYNSSSNTTGFTASTTAYVRGGSCRNVYGGGWLGHVGHHTGDISASPVGDIPGETHVVIGDMAGTSFTNGIPTIQRNAYGGGEGGTVFGTAYLTLNNGYVGYYYNSEGTDNPDTEDFDERYIEKLEDDTQPTPNILLTEAGCMFGGGYIDDSSVDKTHVKLYGGHVRNSLFGGGEVAAIGRGDMKEKPGGKDFELKGIYRPGKTLVDMFDGHVHRNIFGGGRGYDNLDRHGSLHTDGFIFGQTEVHVHGGEVGTLAGVADGDGNVFGGCDIGLVYSAYEITPTTFGKGVKEGVRYDNMYQGYYYKHDWADDGDFVTENIYYTQAEIDAAVYGDGAYGKTTSDVKETERQFTEDCKVLIEPHLKVNIPVLINGHSYKAGEFVPINDLNTMQNKDSDAERWACLDQKGVIIHNAVFAGGNAPSGSITTSANTNTVFGNATASVNDIFHRDMITMGTRHTGGLYGDGNLTLVDGYRELNITNYGTDYYSIAKEIGIDTYHTLPEREADYYELKYTCLKNCEDKEGTRYKQETTDEHGNTTKASTITADEMQNLFVEIKDGEKVSVKKDGVAILTFDETRQEWIPNTAAGANFWKESGVLPVYAGRLMNSIQRADFCGVFGSRMVMQGAQDRVPEEADYTNYTINRVREVSLNKVDSKISSDLAIAEGNEEYYKKHRHGNYFGIYNVVNYLGALTSDVHFSDVRKTDNTNDELYKKTVDGKPYGTATFYDWKKENIKNKTRNNGSSYNKVALASGVYLEITTEESTGDDLNEKVWGPITGIVELDLINVSTGIGGGFVYAKNVHGKPSTTGYKNTTLTSLNEEAVTKWDYDYIEINSTGKAESEQHEWETSGNFVHSTQTIIDDCYNVSNRYLLSDDKRVPAHFWYIKGSVYVYDQYISAYTGTPNAYSETVDIPLTIAAASHGRMKLLNVMPNRYAYYAAEGVPLADGKKMIINDKTYYKNDPISYWDWYLLSNSEKALFVDSTYTNCVSVNIDDETADGKLKMYEPGTLIMTKEEFESYGTHTYKDAEGNEIQDANKQTADKAYIFRLSNNVSHDEGYILTYEVNNPSLWDNWYTLKDGDYKAKKTLEEYNALPDVATKALYTDGPTYRLKGTGSEVLGQRQYKNGDLISKTVYDAYDAIPSSAKSSLTNQATFVPAYIVKNKITITEGGHETYYNPGTTVPKSFYDDHTSDCEAAYICTASVQMSKEEIIYKDSKLSATQVNGYKTDVAGKMNTISTGSSTKTIAEIKALSLTADKKTQLLQLAAIRDELEANLVQAYYCTSEPAVDEAGNPIYYNYGGSYYVSGNNYRGLEAWSSMSETDREKFDYNYDALDLLIDPYFTNSNTGAYSEGQKYQYDGPNYKSEEAVRNASTGNKAGYSVLQPVDYTASYDSDTPSDISKTIPVLRDGNPTTTKKLQKGDELARDVFEDSLKNEQRHYSPIALKGAGTYYVVKTAFQIGSTPYAVGETISSETYTSLPTEEKKCVTALTVSEDYANKNETHYYCREYYEGTTVTTVSSPDISGGVAGTGDGKVKQGSIITSGQYTALPNEQKNFTIHGISPTETTTFYVSRESDIYDLSKEKIITVIYQYDYDETDDNGNVTPISERHVVNIHLTFKSGVPIVEDITPPSIILPGDFTSLREPNVTPGAYEITGGGWELFATQREAESHTNGVEYNPTFDPLYWYQDDYYVAYYAKSYLGRTYSNAVPVSVANYHDMADVMSDKYKSHHMYIDHKNVKRDPKIYINDYSDSGKNGLDLFKNLYDLSLRTSVAESGDLKGHALLNEKVKGGKDLEFFLRTDIDHSGSSWTSIGSEDDPLTTEVNEEECFKGVLHGDGHTISGLNNSLFKNLCGCVYNLGVTGSFNTAGVVDMGIGYVESAWVKTSATTPLGTKPNAVFGNPTDTKGYQLVNSYFFNGNKGLYGNIAGDEPDVLDYKETITSGGARGVATAKSDTAFYNGELAYDLNNFYLYKRYSDKNASTGSKYSYFTVADDNSLTLHEDGGFYASNPNLCSTGYVDDESNVLKYVESRFEDGDYRFAEGVIPMDEDERHWVKTTLDGGKEVETDEFAPIYPDDYIFFGQKLTYGYNTHPHQDVPTAVVRDEGRLSQNSDANRVYRAPAYYRSKTMGVAHFNPTVYLAQKKQKAKPEYADTLAYPNMTAIDFAGHEEGHDKSAYKLGLQDGWFYSPLLDDDGLISIQNCDETQNLLVYAPAESGESGYINAKTHDVLNSYFADPVYDDYYHNTGDYEGYRLVEENSGIVNGHLVQSNLTATNDHLLVDKQDFNCPIGYAFDSNHLMWYQRKPSDNEYVDRLKGWQGISLPFTAELVTTNQKGEITHFYSKSETAANSTEKIGHEYWLREFKDINIPDGESKAKADLIYPSAIKGGDTKYVTNKFLWDYYYKNESVHNQKDDNEDIYLEYKRYYDETRHYEEYPMMAAAKPYILGLPGQTYYEFDLSGKFEAQNTAERITRLGKQTITFASNKQTSIGVSDDEMGGDTVTYNGLDYIFKPNYMSKTLNTGDYVLNSDGNAYVALVADAATNTSKGVTTAQNAFRPYFVAKTHVSLGGGKHMAPERIVFSDNNDELYEEGPETELNGGLEISTRGRVIVVKSNMKVATTVRIVNVAGVTVTSYVLEPGKTVETPVNAHGTYVVNRKKIFVQ